MHDLPVFGSKSVVQVVEEVKEAVTAMLEFMVTVQVAVVEVQEEDQLVKVEPAPGVAVRVTVVPTG